MVNQSAVPAFTALACGPQGRPQVPFGMNADEQERHEVEDVRSLAHHADNRSRLAAHRPDERRQAADDGGKSDQHCWIKDEHGATPSVHVHHLFPMINRKLPIAYKCAQALVAFSELP
jgi:hypothetical protein